MEGVSIWLFLLWVCQEPEKDNSIYLSMINNINTHRPLVTQGKLNSGQICQVPVETEDSLKY